MATVQTRTLVQPYLQFRGRTEEALEFYKLALGAEISVMMRFSEAPEPCPTPVDGHLVMHAGFRIGETEIFATDGGCQDAGSQTGFQGFSLTLSLSEEETAERFYQALSQDGQPQMPLGPTFFARKFGTVVDKFGVNWIILVPA
ncbi:VOC family protein [bacterium]|nr:VOC family protein [bacterium]